MKIIDAAKLVLAEAGEPMHYRELTRLLLERELWSTQGKTPWETVNSRLCVDLIRYKEASFFVRVEPGTFKLNPDYTPEARKQKIKEVSAMGAAPPKPGAARKSLQEAIEIVLGQSTEPLHYKEIARRVLTQGLWATKGVTPWDTVNSWLAAEAKKGEGARVTRVKPGTYILNSNATPSKSPTSPEPSAFSFTDAAERVLDEFADRHPMHFRAVTRIALEQGWIDTDSLTPEATLASQIQREITRRSKRNESQRFTWQQEGHVGLAGWALRVGLPSRIERHNQNVQDALHKRLSKMEPGDFEEVIGTLLAALGFEEVEVTKLSKDGGIDVRGTLVVADVVRTRMAVQVKRWKNNIHSPTVQQVRGSLGAHEQGLIITTSDFSKGARKEAARADATPVALMSGAQLVKLLLEHEIGVRRTTYPLFELEEEEGE